jgi:lysophospholipase L1-like esterase
MLTIKKLFLTAVSILLFAACQTAPKPIASAPPVASAPPTASSVPSVDPFWPADGVFPVPGHTSSWSGFRAKNIERRTTFASRRDLDQNALVFVGDSITEGWNTLESDFANLGVKVANRGIGGDTTPNLIYRLQDDVLSLHPRALVVLIGTNDLGEHTTPEQIASNLRELHRRIRAAYPNIPLTWCLVMPRKGNDTYPDRIRDLNQRITELVASDPHATICDTFTPLALPDGSSKPEDYVPDRLHLNAAGYETWRSTLMPILTSWNLRPE